MRIRLAVDRVETGGLGSAAAGEARVGEVEAVPEEMDGALLAAEPAGELVEDGVGPAQHPPVALDVLALVAGVLLVLGERRRDRDPERRLDDLDVEPVFAEQPVQARVEGCDREAVLEREPGGDAAVGAQDEAVIDEVEGQVEAHVAVRQAAGGQAAHVHVERDVPPVVARLRRCQLDLADDLRVQVQRLLRLLPGGVRELGQSLSRSRRRKRPRR